MVWPFNTLQLYNIVAQGSGRFQELQTKTNAPPLMGEAFNSLNISFFLYKLNSKELLINHLFRQNCKHGGVL
jgi:hypothetical protein